MLVRDELERTCVSHPRERAAARRCFSTAAVSHSARSRKVLRRGNLQSPPLPCALVGAAVRKSADGVILDLMAPIAAIIRPGQRPFLMPVPSENTEVGFGRIPSLCIYSSTRVRVQGKSLSRVTTVAIARAQHGEGGAAATRIRVSLFNAKKRAVRVRAGS
jgi:hypothetical protein